MRLTKLAVAVTLSLSLACTEDDAPAPPAEQTASASTMAHGDHKARYGGTVWMHGDLHFEVVLDPSGQHRVYFSDAFRNELPAAVASDVRITIVRAEGEPEPLALEVDEFGESWVASGREVLDPDARALVEFTYEGEPYEIDVPFLAEPLGPDAPDPHTVPDGR